MDVTIPVLLGGIDHGANLLGAKRSINSQGCSLLMAVFDNPRFLDVAKSTTDMTHHVQAVCTLCGLGRGEA
jgi:hypothetical protein